jgi:hypothetical protein
LIRQAAPWICRFRTVLLVSAAALGCGSAAAAEPPPLPPPPASPGPPASRGPGAAAIGPLRIDGSNQRPLPEAPVRLRSSPAPDTQPVAIPMEPGLEFRPRMDPDPYQRPAFRGLLRWDLQQLR